VSRRDDIDNFVENLVRIGVDQLDSELGTQRDRAETAMRRVAEQLCAAYAGRPMYVPVAYDPRNREIVEKYGRQGRAARAYSPERVTELAVEYQLGERRIYGILAQARAEEFAARQPALPGFEDPAENRA
jgi:Mor family transcriptional regulator